MFGLQGLLGSVAAAIGKTVVTAASPQLFNDSALFDYNSGKLIVYGLISSGMGIAFGAIIGLICYAINIQSDKLYFNDGFNWIVGSDIDDVSTKIIKPKLIEGNRISY